MGINDNSHEQRTAANYPAKVGAYYRDAIMHNDNPTEQRGLPLWGIGEWDI